MKKLLFMLIAVGIFATNVKAQTISWPFGKPDVVTKTDRLTSDVTISNRLTVLNYGTLDTTMLITVSPVKGLSPGAILVIVAKSNTTARTVTFSTGFKATTLAGTISKTKVATFVYDGSYFYNIAQQQVD